MRVLNHLRDLATILPIFLSCLFWSGSCFLSAQTRVEKYTLDTSRKGGVVYHLPKTYIRLSVEYTQNKVYRGDLAAYAQEFLGDTAAIQKDTDTYHIDGVNISTYGVPNKEESYQIRFKEGSVAPYVMLTEDGLLCAVNRTVDASEEDAGMGKVNSQRKEESLQRVNLTDLLPVEYIRATTAERRAKVAAREYFYTRENLLNVLRGDAEQPFPDGAAMKLAVSKLEERVQALRSLFSGYTETKALQNVFEGFGADSTYSCIAFRFSKHLGPLAADDLSGDPVYLQAEVLEKAEDLTEREQRKLEKSLKGLVYIQPGKLKVSLKYRGKVLAEKTVAVAQLGRKQSLAPVLFDTRRGGTVTVFLYPASAALREIQEVQSP